MRKLNLLFSLLLALATASCLAGYFAVHQLKIAADAAMHLSCASKILDRALPYLDFMDNSSPFILYLSCLPVAVSRMIFIHPACIFNMLVTGLALAVAACTIKLAQPGRRLLLLQFNLPPLFLATAVVQFYFVKEFGQESMVFFLLFLPYIVERYLSLSAIHRQQNKLRLGLVGVSSALALLLNPVYLLALPVVEVVCLASLGQITGPKIKRYFSLELLTCLASILFLTAGLYMLAPSVVQEYLGPVARINWLSFEYFNDALNYVDKSPDRRDLVYAFVVFFVLSLPVAGRCLLTRLLCAMAAFGFAYYVYSGTLFSHEGILMTAYALAAFSIAMARYWRSWRPTKDISAKLAENFEKISGRFMYLALAVLPVVCFIGSYFVAIKSVGDTFSLHDFGYYGFGISRDLSYFSKSVLKNSNARDTVWVYSEQVRPGFPLLTQLRRSQGYLSWGFLLHTLKILHERGTPEQISQMVPFEAQIYNRLRTELLSNHPPQQILIEDGEVQELFKANGILAIIERFYDPLDSCSPLDGAEIDAHEPYEYLGYRVGFSTYRLHK